MTTADRFAAFARSAEAGGSPLYADWADGFALDEGLLALVDRARESQRQPVLVFAVCRILGAPLAPFVTLRAWLLAHADVVLPELDRRRTQTNDVRRAAPVAAALARIDGPVALLEVGAAAGLGLRPDLFRIDVRDGDGSRILGDPSGDVRLRLDVGGSLGLPGDASLPAVVDRRGLDLSPLDPASDDDALWLETLLWPGQDDRVDLLRRAVAIARQEPATVTRGDAVDGLDALVRAAPAGAVPVVITSGTLVYLPGARRQAFVDRVGALGVRWISYEKTGLLEGVQATLPDPAIADGWFATLALDGRAIAVGDAHGTRLRAL
ncbi:hypothetical protein AS850_02490 [Frondihabitans sp. 762G35]|uniref:DUF2332 domain-containing protein n=1 Tax=Frondihabitans sp. 762G35 TaxID=1446794 RepID=UPI000D228456|nr:DUF2332 domain-containing protein [Frondihabitans sp. 762G35]ARC55941.1 hypothetical protein AS850_02490 [Frondihabitans sp. 762G35]